MRPHPALSELGAGTLAAGNARRSMKFARIRLAVSRTPQRQSHSTRGTGGRPRLAFVVPRRSTRSEALGRSEHMVKCARILRPVNWVTQLQLAFPRAGVPQDQYEKPPTAPPKARSRSRGLPRSDPPVSNTLDSALLEKDPSPTSSTVSRHLQPATIYLEVSVGA
jgi:hypothetical protein